MARQTLQLRQGTVLAPDGLRNAVSGLVAAWEELTSYFLIMGRSIRSGISEESIKRFDINCAKFDGR